MCLPLGSNEVQQNEKLINDLGGKNKALEEDLIYSTLLEKEIFYMNGFVK